MDEGGGRIEEGHVRRAGDWPDVRDTAGVAIDFDQGTVVAYGVEAPARMVNVETMCATRWKLPVGEWAQIGQAGNQDHRRFADAQEYALGGRIGHAPSGPAGEIDRRLFTIIQVKSLQCRGLALISDAGDDPEGGPFHNRCAIGT